jgi:hypothetical protein
MCCTGSECGKLFVKAAYEGKSDEASNRNCHKNVDSEPSTCFLQMEFLRYHVVCLCMKKSSQFKSPYVWLR